MSKPLRPKRGTTAENDAFTGLPYEVTLDTDTHRLRTHDGVTAGGYEHALKSDIPGVMTGATDSTPGTSGRVPVPAAGKQDKPLTGGGQYADFIDCVVTALKDPSGNIDAAKLKQMLAAFLPLAGGTMTGPINFAGGQINGVTTTQIAMIAGVGGGYVRQLSKIDPSLPGATEIAARSDDDNVVHIIQVTRDGCLADGVHIVRSINGTKAGADGNVTLTISSGVTFAEATYTRNAIYAPNYGTMWGIFGSGQYYDGSSNKSFNVTPNRFGPGEQIVGNLRAVTWKQKKIVCLLLG